MKLLLTSNGITNKSLKTALLGLLGKPFEQSSLVFIPTAANAEPEDKQWLIDDFANIKKLSFKEIYIVDLAAEASLPKELWWKQIEDADVILVGGGNNFYLSYWMDKSGLFDALPKLLESKVYVGISAGSMAVTAHLRVTGEALAKFGQLKDDEYGELGPEGQSLNKTIKLVDFVVRPHFNSPFFPKINENFLNEVAQTIKEPIYALDDQSAVKIDDAEVEVVSEGEWKLIKG